MSTEAATPAAQPGGTPPAAPAAAPASAEQVVTLSKEKHDQLVRDAARASEAQSRADRLEAARRRNPGHFTPQQPATPPSPEEAAQRASEEDRKAERGLMALAVDPVLREVLDSDPTLRDLLVKNPLAVLPVLAPDAIDAEDAVSLVREALNKRVSTKVPVTPPAPVTTPPTPAPAAPPAGGVNPQDKPVDAEYEAARKIPGTEQAIAGMIKVGIKRQAPNK